jgi:hypothetical protein
VFQPLSSCKTHLALYKLDTVLGESHIFFIRNISNPLPVIES